MKYLYLLILLILASTACKEVINLDLPYNEPRIVIDGLITNLKEPYIITITKTSKYNYTYYESKIYIENALVIIHDDAGNKDTLQEISQGTYVTDTNRIVGTMGRLYTLEIQTLNDGNWISKPERMLPVPEIDSMYYERDKYDRYEEDLQRYKFMIYVDWQDPVNENNYYLRNISYNWGDKWQTNYNWNWVFDDKYLDGLYLKKSLLQEDYGGVPFKVKLKQYSLTQSAFEFWNMVHEQTQLSDNDMTNSSIPLYGNVYNIENPSEFALGYFQVSAVTEAIVNVDR